MMQSLGLALDGVIVLALFDELKLSEMKSTIFTIIRKDDECNVEAHRKTQLMYLTY